MFRKIYYAVSFILLPVCLLLSFCWSGAWITLLFIIPYVIIGYLDLKSVRNVLRNYPVVGHLRYILEFIRPEIQQYFVATNESGRPFSREVRSLVYQRAKQVNDTLPFGTQHDITGHGFEYAFHSLHPVEVEQQHARMIFGRDTKHPYHASRLNISAMSYGALGHTAVEALNLGAKIGNFAQNTGEGGLTEYHLKHGGDIIWQIGTGYFSCRTLDGHFDAKAFAEKAQHEHVKMIELKLSQGAKPSHGGVLPAAKVTAEIAAFRGVKQGEDCLSPPAHSAFTGPVGLLEFIQQLREMSGHKPVGFKLCIGKPIEFMQICKAMLETNILPDFITVDGAEGGTGAAPVEFTNRFGMPINEGLNFVNQLLIGCDLRDKIRLIASGKVATGFDMITKVALGADTCNAARAMMFATGCIQALRCNTNTCPTGVTTLDPNRTQAVVPEEKCHHIKNYHHATVNSFLTLLGAMGIDDPTQLTPAHIMKRGDDQIGVPYTNFLPTLQPGELLDKHYSGEFAELWNNI